MADRPTIQKGKRLEYTKRPFLGKSRVGYLIALYNALTNLQVKVVSQVGSTGTDPSALNNIKPDFSFDANGNAVLTIPFTQGQGTTQGWFWTPGARNYDPTATYVDQQLVYVQASSTAATTGLLDASAGTIKKALPGIWVALQAVAPQSGPSYYLPRLPMPEDDDMNSSSNYWAFVSAIPTCV